jgi:hypothetical protein
MREGDRDRDDGVVDAHDRAAHVRVCVLAQSLQERRDVRRRDGPGQVHMVCARLWGPRGCLVSAS